MVCRLGAFQSPLVFIARLAPLVRERVFAVPPRVRFAFVAALRERRLLPFLGLAGPLLLRAFMAERFPAALRPGVFAVRDILAEAPVDFFREIELRFREFPEFVLFLCCIFPFWAWLCFVAVENRIEFLKT